MRAWLSVVAILLTCLMLQSCASARMAQELELGKLKFESGDFKAAFHQLLPLAAEGNASAQYAVGYMYYYGYGVSEERESGLFWINKSASKGFVPAIKALKRINR